MINVHPEVAEAIAAKVPVVCLESTIIAHGLPRPNNLEIAGQIEQVVRDAGALPATIACLDGSIQVGLTAEELQRVATDDEVGKVGARDLPGAIVAGQSAATTVSATVQIAAQVGINVFATGGLGGVHRGANLTFDESADLTALANTSICVVCSGVKSILDVPATLERLETLGVMVGAYRTKSFPGFYLTDSGHQIGWQIDSPSDAAAALWAARAIGIRSGLVVANPLSTEDALDQDEHDRVLAAALAEADQKGINGKAVTPFLLRRIAEVTEGASVEANVKLVLGNAKLAGEIAVNLERQAAAR